MRTKAEQMAFAFYDGGMVDSGVKVDPSSGNEVPPGSLKEEVSDKVDAKLSEGEYVVPANVVQFYGLDKFEKMVTKAKEQLAEMEANGRIGGEPVGDETGDDDELPLSDEELMAEEGEQGFAEGGAVTAPNGVQSKTYVGPSGEKRTVLFVGGQPIQAIPAGFVPEGEKKSQDKEKAKMDPFDSMGGPDVGEGHDPTPVSEWGDNEFGEFLGTQDNMKAGMVAMNAIGGPLAAGMARAANNTTGAQALAEVESRLGNESISPEEKGKLEGYKEGLEGFRGKGLGSGLLGGLLGTNKSETTSTTPAQGKGLLGGLIGPQGLLGGFMSRGRQSGSATTGGNEASGTSSPSGGSKGPSGNPDAPGASPYSGMAKGGLVKRRK